MAATNIFIVLIIALVWLEPPANRMRPRRQAHPLSSLASTVQVRSSTKQLLVSGLLVSVPATVTAKEQARHQATRDENAGAKKKTKKKSKKHRTKKEGEVPPTSSDTTPLNAATDSKTERGASRKRGQGNMMQTDWPDAIDPESMIDRQREHVASNPNDDQARKQLIGMLSTFGRSLERSHDAAAASAILREILALDPPLDVAKWDRWEGEQRQLERELRSRQDADDDAEAEDAVLVADLAELEDLLRRGTLRQRTLDALRAESEAVATELEAVRQRRAESEKERGGGSGGGRSCVAATPILIEPPPLSFRPSLMGSTSDDTPDPSAGGLPSVHASELTPRLLKQHARRNAPLVIRGGATHGGMCSVDASWMNESAHSEIVKAYFAFPPEAPLTSPSPTHVNSSVYLDELYKVHTYSKMWTDMRPQLPRQYHDAPALLHPAVQWMHFGTFIKLATEPPPLLPGATRGHAGAGGAGDHEDAEGHDDVFARQAQNQRRVNMFQTSVKTQLPMLADRTACPDWATEALGELLEHNLWIGSGGSCSKLHMDAYDNIIGVVRGERELLLFPPASHSALQFEKAAVLRAEYRDDNETAAKGDAEGYNVQLQKTFIHNHALRDHLRDSPYGKVSDPWPAGSRVRLQPGDALFLPAWWAHAVHQSAGAEPAAACDEKGAGGDGGRGEGAAWSEGGGRDDRCLSIAVNWWFRPLLSRAEADASPWGVAQKQGERPVRDDL